MCIKYFRKSLFFPKRLIRNSRMIKTKRERGKNFSEKEKRIFADIICIEKFRNILENKKTDYETTKCKAEAWIEIAKIFNAQTDEEERPVNQLKTYYENLKSKRKKCSAEESLLIYPPVLNEEDEKVLLDIVKEHSEIIDNVKPDISNLKKAVWEAVTNEFNSKVKNKRSLTFLELYYKHYKIKQKVNVSSKNRS